MMIDKKEIVKLEAELLEAIKISDVSVLGRLLHNDLLFITPDGKTITKEMGLAAHRSGTMVVDEIKSTIEQII